MRHLTPRFTIFSLLIALLLLLICLSLLTGQTGVGIEQLIALIKGEASNKTYQVIVRIRLPRLLACLAAGASLALSGAILQTLTRNPLADSGILGINAGAGVAVAVMIGYVSLRATWVISSLSLFAMLGGLMAVWGVYYLAKTRTGLDPMRLILAGVGVSTLLSALTLSIAFNVNPFKTEAMLAWLSGKITGDNWATLKLMLPILSLCWIGVYLLRYPLNILALNPQSAMAVGLNVERLRIVSLCLATALASMSVVLVGNITFIGLIAGHLAKRLIGANHRDFLLGAYLIGMILLTGADVLCRQFFVGTGMPTGLMVAIIGAPYFLVLMLRKGV